MRAATTPPLLARWWLLGRAALARSATAQGTGAATAAAAAPRRAASSAAAAVPSPNDADAADDANVAAADPLSAALAERRLAAQAAGTWKRERVIRGPQGRSVRVGDRDLLNFCANNYMGLCNHPRVVAAARDALGTHGFGLASVRFICGTTDLHVELERRLAGWLGAEDAVLFPSCFDANAGVFEALLGAEDAIVSDSLNHASIIDGARLCKARRFRYAHADVAALEEALGQAREAGARATVVVTDGVFSMDGAVAPLDRIVPAVRAAGGPGGGVYLMVDDCHASGFWGATGRGTAEACGLLDGGAGGGAGGGGGAGEAAATANATAATGTAAAVTAAAATSPATKAPPPPPPMMGGVDLLSSTLGKALGGATGGFVCGRADAVAALRQSARPYLFSNTLAPSVAAASLAVLDIVQGAEGDALRARLRRNAALFRGAMEEAGFSLGGGGRGGGGGGGNVGSDGAASSSSASPHPIVPVMLGDAALASEFARRMLDDRGIYVVAFSFPVVPRGRARIRVQLSAAHSEEDVKACAAAFAAVGRELGVVR